MEVFAAYNRARFSSLLDGRWTLTWVASPMSKCGHEKLDGEQIIKGATFTEGVRHPGDLERVVTFGCDCTFAITLKNQS